MFGPQQRISLAVIPLAVMLGGCAVPPGDGAPTPEWAEAEVRINIAEAVVQDTADVRQAPTRLAFSDARDMRYLPSGWYPPGSSNGSARYGVWTKGAASVLEVPIAEPGPLDVTLRVRSVAGEAELPSQYMTLAWNGQPIGRYPVRVPVHPVQVSIPEKSQRTGLNVMTIAPHFWIDPSDEARASKEIKRGIRVESVEALHSGALVGDPARVVAADGHDVIQQAGTIFSYYAVVPASARLRGGLAIEGTDRSDGDQSIAVWLARDHEPPRVLLTRRAVDLSRDGPHDFDLDLSDLAGHAIALTFVVGSVSADPGDQARRAGAIRWRAPRLEGLRRTKPRRPQTPERKPYNVLVVLFDTLRADFTEPFGATTVRTPEMTRLAESGIAFLRTSANASSTRPSVASLLTGLYPPAHKVDILAAALSGEVPYLPSLLVDSGYTTVAVSNNPHIAEAWGFARGFTAFTEFFGFEEDRLRQDYPNPEKRARYAWEEFVAPTLAARNDRPFFVYLHEIDPHFPYEPLPPYDHMYDFGYAGRLAAEPFPTTTKNPLVSYVQVGRLLGALNDYPGWLGPSDIAYLRSRYAGEVSYMDAYLGWVLRRLEADGVRENTVVIFLSDHGEEFFEHAGWTHGPTVFDEVTHVPLIVALPATLPAARRPIVNAELVDVAPTILDLLDIEQPKSMQGRSLLPYMFGSEDYVDTNPVFAYSDATFDKQGDGSVVVRTQQSVRLKDWKLVRTVRVLAGSSSDSFALYDLAADSAESVNIWPTSPILGHTLKQVLESQHFVNAQLVFDGTGDVTIEGEMRNRLQALGYLD